MRSGVVLSGGKSSRIGQDKGLVILDGRPLVSWVIERLKLVVDEVIIVVGSDSVILEYRTLIPNDVRVVSDCYQEDSPMIGLISGLGEAKGEYAVVTACDMPFIRPDVLERLFQAAEGKSGTLIVKPDGWVEPLPAVYRISSCLEYAESLRLRGELRIRKVLETMNGIVRVSIDELRVVDSELVSFIDLDTLESLQEAKRLIESESV
jgi:molybdopterin-guanine dinucleotide biosynthesis protein A